MNSSEKKSCAFAVHADISAAQVWLQVNASRKLVRVLNHLQHCTSVFSAPGREEEIVRPRPDTSFAVLQHSVSSMSEIATPVQLNLQPADPRQGMREGSNTSIWIQCTVPSLTFCLITPGDRRISLTMEESSISYDCQSAYTKVSVRLRGLSSKVERQTGQGAWNDCPLQDLVISCNKDLFPQLSMYVPDSEDGGSFGEDSGPLDHQTLSTAFFNLVLTRAEVSNVHRKMKLCDEILQAEQEGCRYLAEVDVEVYPIDVYLSTDCIHQFMSALLPFLDLVASPKQSSPQPVLSSLNNNTLPLLYFKSKRCRLFIHQPGGEGCGQQPDFLLVECERAKLTCQVENPLSRILVDEKGFSDFRAQCFKFCPVI